MVVSRAIFVAILTRLFAPSCVVQEKSVVLAFTTAHLVAEPSWML
jgi:hypothetical protein